MPAVLPPGPSRYHNVPGISYAGRFEGRVPEAPQSLRKRLSRVVLMDIQSERITSRQCRVLRARDKAAADGAENDMFPVQRETVFEDVTSRMPDVIAEYCLRQKMCLNSGSSRLCRLQIYETVLSVNDSQVADLRSQPGNSGAYWSFLSIRMPGIWRRSRRIRPPLARVHPNR